MLSFTTAHVAVVALRVQASPTASARTGCRGTCASAARDIPLSAVLGAIGTFAAWVSVVVLHVEARTVGIAVDGGRHGRLLRLPPAPGLDLASRRRSTAASGRRTSCQLEYRSALVPIFGDDVSAEALAAAARLVGERRRGRRRLCHQRAAPAPARRPPARRRSAGATCSRPLS